MANDWLKIKVDGGSWGTTATGPSGTTGISISASSCDESIARSATIVFKAGSLTKRLKVTQGIAASPKIQMTQDLTIIGIGQTATINLTVSNVEDLNNWTWRITPSGPTNKVTITGPLSGNSTTATITVKNISAESGDIELVAELLSSESRVLSSDTKKIVLTRSLNPDPIITIVYAGGNSMDIRKGMEEQFTVNVSNISRATSYSWTLSIDNASFRSGVVITPSTASNTPTVSVTIKNNDYQAGSTKMKATLTANYTGEDPKTVVSNEITINFKQERFININGQYTGDVVCGLPNAIAISENGTISAKVAVNVSDGDDWEIEGITATTVSGAKPTGSASPVGMEKRVVREQTGEDVVRLCIFNYNSESAYINDQANSFIGKVIIRNHPDYYAMVSGTCVHQAITIVINNCWEPKAVKLGPEAGNSATIKFNIENVADEYKDKMRNIKYRINSEAGYSSQFTITSTTCESYDHSGPDGANGWVFAAGTSAEFTITTNKALSSAVFTKTLTATAIESTGGDYQFNNSDPASQASITQKQVSEFIVTPSAFIGDNSISYNGKNIQGSTPYIDIYCDYAYSLLFFPDPNTDYYLTGITNNTTGIEVVQNGEDLSYGSAGEVTRFTLRFSDNVSERVKTGNIRIVYQKDGSGVPVDVTVNQKNVPFYAAATIDVSVESEYQTQEFSVGGGQHNNCGLVLTGDSSLSYVVRNSTVDWFVFPNWPDNSYGPLTPEKTILPFDIPFNQGNNPRTTTISVSAYSDSSFSEFVAERTIVVRQAGKSDYYIYYRFANGNQQFLPITDINYFNEYGDVYTMSITLGEVPFDTSKWKVVCDGEEQVNVPEEVSLEWHLDVNFVFDGNSYDTVYTVNLNKTMEISGPVSSLVDYYTGLMDDTVNIPAEFVDRIRSYADQYDGGKLAIVLRPEVASGQYLSQSYIIQNAETGDWYNFGQYYGFIRPKSQMDESGTWEKRNSGNPMTGQLNI